MTSTDVAKAASTTVAHREEMPDGLEDISVTDMTLPIIKTLHKVGCFEDQAGEQFDEFDGIILGVIKQRVLWPTEPGEAGVGPVCRAVNFTTGHPDMAKFITKDSGTTAQKRSGFSLADVESAVESGEGLACVDCKLQEWKTNPKDNRSPWCTEQWTMPVLRIAEDGTSSIAIISFQRTGLKPCRNYISTFSTAKKPLYTAVTRIRAVAVSKGTVDYVVPKFSLVSETDRSEWPTYSKSLHEIRDYLTTPRFREDDDDTATPVAKDDDDDEEVIEVEEVVVVVEEKPVATEPDPADDAPAKPPKRVEPAPVVVAAADDDDDDDDDEEPF
jgi:hypothetical protein